MKWHHSQNSEDLFLFAKLFSRYGGNVVVTVLKEHAVLWRVAYESLMFIQFMRSYPSSPRPPPSYQHPFPNLGRVSMSQEENKNFDIY